MSKPFKLPHPGLVALYNRLSLEHELPLGVAKAIVGLSATLMPSVRKARNDREGQALCDLPGRVFITLAENLNLPEKRLLTACDEAMVGAANVYVEAYKEFLEKEKANRGP